MSDTETETQIRVDATDAQTDPDTITTKVRVSSTIDGSVVTVTDAAGSATYDLANIPVTAYPALAALALRDLLIRSHDRAKTYAALVAGTVPGRKASAAKKALAPARKAIALAMADAEALEKGVKRFAPGGKINSDYAMILENCEQTAAGLDRAGAATWSKKRAVMEHLAKLIGE